jgi:hypothetical protein
MQLGKHVPKFISAVVVMLATIFLLSSCNTYVENRPGPRDWVPGHYDRMGYWIPGHAVGGGYGGRAWAPGHYNRNGRWAPGHWR